MQQGFTLVEVLVAVVILSIGVLGAVGMQATSLQANKEVRYQTVAVGLARELAEKMRGNHVVAVKTLAAENPYLVDLTLTGSTAVAAAPTNCFTAGCPNDGVAVAKWDMSEWQQRVKDALPSARIKICMDLQPYTAGGIAQWTCTNTGDVAVLKLAWNRANTKGELEFTSNGLVPLVVLPLTAGSSE